MEEPEFKGNAAENVHNTVLGLAKGLSGKALDIGAYDGVLAVKLKELGFETSACDIDTSRFDENKLGIKCDKADLNEGLPYPDNSFDLVCLVEVIEHLKRPYDAVQEISRVLKKNGVLVITTPNILNWYSRFKFFVDGYYNHYFSEKQFLGEGYHISPMHFWQLRYLLSQAGLEIEETTSNKYLGKLNFSYPKIFVFSLISLVLRPFMKLKEKPLFEGDILIIKARKK